MSADKARLRRAMLIERIRATEHRTAATEASRAAAASRKLADLSERTRTLAQLYSVRDQAMDAADLRSASLMGAQLRRIGREAEQQAQVARANAEARFADLALAERRRQRSEGSRQDLVRLIRDKQASANLPLGRKVGTPLE